MIATTWLSQGGFIFEAGGVRIVVDPYMGDTVERLHGVTRIVSFPLALRDLKPDVLFCTHDHLDHLEPDTVVAVATAYPRCQLVGPSSCYTHFLNLGLPAERCREVHVGGSFDCGEAMLTPVPAFHSDPAAVGLVLSVGASKLYLSADTTYSDALINEWTTGSDALLICINGRLGNMNGDEALRIVSALRPHLALPMHYGLFEENTADPEPFIQGCRARGVESFAMPLGTPFPILPATQ